MSNYNFLQYFTSISIATVLSVIIVYAFKFYKNLKYWENKIEYINPLPFFGNFLPVVLKERTFGEQIRHLYDRLDLPYFGIHIFNTPYLLIKDPAVIKKILIKDFNVFADRRIAANIQIDPLAYHSMFIARNKVWKPMRTKVSPVFTSGKMKLMMPLIVNCSDDLLNYLDRKKGEVFDAKEAMSRFTVDVISVCAFGVGAKCLRCEDSEIRKRSKSLLDFDSFVRVFSIFSYFFFPCFVKLFRLRFLDKSSSEFFIDVFTTTYEERKKENIVRNDLIDLLHSIKDTETVDDSYKFDDLKMTSQAVTFFTAGNETTSIAMAFMLYEIAINQEIQDRLRSEIDEIFNTFGTLSYEHLSDLKYLDMVVKETLRKYPFASFLTRMANTDYTFEDSGLVLKEGMSVIIPLSGIHLDANYFPEPEKFIPERFDPDDKGRVRSFTYLPFGDGPRNCIGERFSLLVMKIGVSHMLRNYIFLKSDRTTVPIEINKAAPFLQPKNGIPLRVIKRDDL